MVSTDLGSCEWFVWDLRRSNLIDRGQLDQLVGEFLQTHPRADPPALAEFLVDRGILSQFQADRLLQGKTQGFVLGPFTLALATYFLVSNGNDGFSSRNGGVPDDWWSGYDVELGAPLNDHYVWGSLFRRDFAGGLVS